MTNSLENYRTGAIWRTRQDIEAICENGKKIVIPRNKLILILKIIEEFKLTYLKILYENKLYYILEIEDIGINFYYQYDKVFI